jgi:hypothetical protein
MIDYFWLYDMLKILTMKLTAFIAWIRMNLP